MSSSPNVPVPGVTVTLSGNTSPGQGGVCVDCSSYRRYADQAREELTALRQRVAGLEVELAAEREEKDAVLAAGKEFILAHIALRMDMNRANLHRFNNAELSLMQLADAKAARDAAAAVRRAGGKEQDP